MPLLKEIKDKESNKTRGSAQAFTDARTRDNIEKDYYDSKWLKERFSSEEIKLLKKEFGITSDSALRTKVESMSDYDLDVLLNRLKNPGTTAYPGYKEPDKQPSTNNTTTPGSTPTISKEQEFENTFRLNKTTKGITDAEFDLLKASVGGKETEAKKMVINMPAHILRDIIARQIKANQEALLAITNNSYAHDKLRDDFSEQEIELLKRYFNIYDENKLILKTDSMSDYDMDVLLYRLKQPYRFGTDNTPAYSGYGLDSIVPVSQVQPALSNSNTANNFSDGEIEMLKEHFRTDSEAQALAMAESKSDYELDKIFEFQRMRIKNPDVPFISQASLGGQNYDISSITYWDNRVDDPKDPEYIKTIGYNGCNPVSAVMVAEAFGAYGDKPLGGYTYAQTVSHVHDAADFALGKHDDNKALYKSDTGTSFAFTKAYLNNLGLKTTQTKDQKEVEEALKRGAVVIASVQGAKYADGPTDTFTDNHHVMVITDMNFDGTVNVNNPNTRGYNDYMNTTNSYTLDFINNHLSMGYVIVEPNS